MNNKVLMISSVLATSLFLGAGSAQANTTTNNNMNQQDMAMNEQMGQMNNNMNQQDMAMNDQMGQMNNNMNQQDMAMNGQMGQMNNNMNQQDMAMNGQMGQMNNNMNQQDMAMNDQMGQMNNNMNQQDMAMNEQMGQKTMTPYYNYNGYTTYDGQFTQEYDFVRALQHDNVMIDGYKVNTATSDKDVASSKAVYDSMIDMNKDGQVIHITFDTKPDTISKEMFEKSHMTNNMVDEGKTADGSYMTYETNNGMYKAFFDKHGYLMKVMIS
ncbi:immunodominant staphylococcal antigen IsaB family protein [Staphylococcus xylosus]|uniref:immunodominant staphylococcal antigen IsaB family protein n=2 Tax=Staphylococcus xylosus TaxID=1288 RepID=UPI003CF76C8F